MIQIKPLILAISCVAALMAAESANAWVGVGIGVAAPVYAYPAPAYYPPPPPPPAYPYAYYPAPAYPAPVAAPQAPVSAYNEDCREYSRSVVIDGHTQHVYGHACRQPDGVWKIMD